MSDAVWAPPATALVFFIVSSLVQNLSVRRRASTIAARAIRASLPNGTEVRALRIEPLKQELFEDAEQIQLVATFLSTLPSLVLLAVQDLPRMYTGIILTLSIAVVAIFTLVSFLPLPRWLTRTRFLGASLLSIIAFAVLVLWLFLAIFIPEGP